MDAGPEPQIQGKPRLPSASSLSAVQKANAPWPLFIACHAEGNGTVAARHNLALCKSAEQRLLTEVVPDLIFDGAPNHLLVAEIDNTTAAPIDDLRAGNSWLLSVGNDEALELVKCTKCEIGVLGSRFEAHWQNCSVAVPKADPGAGAALGVGANLKRAPFDNGSLVAKRCGKKKEAKPKGRGATQKQPQGRGAKGPLPSRLGPGPMERAASGVLPVMQAPGRAGISGLQAINSAYDIPQAPRPLYAPNHAEGDVPDESINTLWQEWSGEAATPPRKVMAPPPVPELMPAVRRRPVVKLRTSIPNNDAAFLLPAAPLQSRRKRTANLRRRRQTAWTLFTDEAQAAGKPNPKKRARQPVIGRGMTLAPRQEQQDSPRGTASAPPGAAEGRPEKRRWIMNPPKILAGHGHGPQRSQSANLPGEPQAYTMVPQQPVNSTGYPGGGAVYAGDPKSAGVVPQPVGNAQGATTGYGGSQAMSSAMYMPTMSGTAGFATSGPQGASMQMPQGYAPSQQVGFTPEQTAAMRGGANLATYAGQAPTLTSGMVPVSQLGGQPTQWAVSNSAYMLNQNGQPVSYVAQPTVTYVQQAPGQYMQYSGGQQVFYAMPAGPQQPTHIMTYPPAMSQYNPQAAGTGASGVLPGAPASSTTGEGDWQFVAPGGDTKIKHEQQQAVATPGASSLSSREQLELQQKEQQLKLQQQALRRPPQPTPQYQQWAPQQVPTQMQGVQIVGGQQQVGQHGNQHNTHCMSPRMQQAMQQNYQAQIQGQGQYAQYMPAAQMHVAVSGQMHATSQQMLAGHHGQLVQGSSQSLQAPGHGMSQQMLTTQHLQASGQTTQTLGHQTYAVSHQLQPGPQQAGQHMTNAASHPQGQLIMTNAASQPQGNAAGSFASPPQPGILGVAAGQVTPPAPQPSNEARLVPIEGSTNIGGSSAKGRGSARTAGSPLQAPSANVISPNVMKMVTLKVDSPLEAAPAPTSARGPPQPSAQNPRASAPASTRGRKGSASLASSAGAKPAGIAPAPASGPPLASGVAGPNTSAHPMMATKAGQKGPGMAVFPANGAMGMQPMMTPPWAGHPVATPVPNGGGVQNGKVV